MKKKTIIIIGIFVLLFLALGVAFFLFIRNYVYMSNWDVHKKMTDYEKESLSNRLMIPDCADTFECYGVTGMRDPKYEVESFAYADLDKLCEALPEGYRSIIRDTVEKSSPESARDIMNKKVTRYAVNEGLPLITEDDLDEKYKGQSQFCMREYYVYAYPDGTYRMASVLITT